MPVHFAGHKALVEHDYFVWMSSYLPSEVD
jgi:hypothetical protein